MRITACVEDQAKDMIVFSDDTLLRGFNKNGFFWESNRISLDGIRNLAIQGDEISGEAYDPSTDRWDSFIVNKFSGHVSYEERKGFSR